MLETSDNRKFVRMGAECELTFIHPNSQQIGHGNSINLSAAGILFKTNEKLSAGSALDISVKPVSPITPPLNALIEIVRVVAIENGEYEVAATIEGIKGESE